MWIMREEFGRRATGGEPLRLPSKVLYTMDLRCEKVLSFEFNTNPVPCDGDNTRS